MGGKCHARWLYSHERSVCGLQVWKPKPLSGFEPQTVQPIVFHCKDYAIPVACLFCTYVLHYCVSYGFLGMAVWMYSWLGISAGSIWEWQDREFGLEIMYSEKVCNSINGTMKVMWIIKHLVVEDENFLPISVQYDLRGVDLFMHFPFYCCKFFLKNGKIG